MAARSASSKRRRRGRSGEFVWKLGVPIALLVVIAVIAFVLLRPSPPPTAGPTAAAACPNVPDQFVGGIRVPAGPIEGYCQPALINAAQIISASRRYSADEHAMDIGVMVAIGESNLQNLNYGDTAGPDSRGIFQQRANWGTLAERMDPYTAAYNFYHRMFQVLGWESLAPTAVAHLVQGNANPNYYTPYFPRAQQLVAALLADRLPPPLTASPTP